MSTRNARLLIQSPIESIDPQRRREYSSAENGLSAAAGKNCGISVSSRTSFRAEPVNLPRHCPPTNPPSQVPPDFCRMCQMQRSPSLPQRNHSYWSARSAFGCMSLNAAGDTAQFREVVAQSVYHPQYLTSRMTIETAFIGLNWRMKPTFQLPTNVSTENSTRGTVFCAVFRTADLGN
jgi:hypothetical protein